MKRTKQPVSDRVEKYIQVNIQKQRQLSQIFASSGWLSVNRGMMKTYGALCALFMSQVIDSFEYHANREQLQPDGSFFMKTAAIAENLGMSEHQVRRCKMEMKEAGVITTIMKGVPPKEYYFLDMGIMLQSVYRINPKEIGGLTLKELEEYIKDLKDKKPNDKKENSSKHLSKKIKFEEILNMFPEEWQQDKSFQKNIKDFIQHRKEKGSSLTKIAATRLASKLSKYSIQEANEALERTMENGWQGVFPENGNGNGNGKLRNGYKTAGKQYPTGETQ